MNRRVLLPIWLLGLFAFSAQITNAQTAIVSAYTGQKANSFEAKTKASFPDQAALIEASALEDFGIALADELLTGGTITTLPIPGNNFCRSSTVNVFFTTDDVIFGPSNQFIAQLSDETGSFASPLNIGTIALSGTVPTASIFAVMPGAFVAGTNYRIRVISTEPAIIGSDNGGNITLQNLIAPQFPTITVNGPTQFCALSATTFLVSSIAQNQLWYNGSGNNPTTVLNNQPFLGVFESGDYYTLYNANNGCQTNSQPVSIVVNTPIFYFLGLYENGQLVSTLNPTEVVICEGDSIEIGISVTGGVPPYTFIYTSDPSDPFLVPTVAVDQPSPFTFFTGVPGTYQLLALNDNFPITCGANGGEGTVILSLTPPPVADFSYEPFCGSTSNAPIPVPDFTPGGTFAFDPDPGDGATIDPVTGIISNAISGNTYIVSYTASNTICERTSNAQVTVEPTDIVAFSYEPFCPGVPSPAPSLAPGFATGGIFAFAVTPSDAATINPSTGVISNSSAVTEYSVQYTSPEGECQNSFTTTVTTLDAPLVALTIESDPNCAAEIGAISSAVSGGSPEYTYAWSNGSDQPNISGLAAGTYTLTVTDELGCIGTASETLTNNPDIAAELVNAVEPSCGSQNGSIEIQIIGGTAPFTITWQPSGSGLLIENLGAGTYTATIVDDAGCETTFSQVLENQEQPEVNLLIENTLCSTNSGSATAVITGGNAPFTYQWVGFPDEDGASITGLGVGSYTVIVTDANSCEATASGFVSLLNPLAFNTSVVQPTCAAPNGGAILIEVTQGTPAYTFTWDDSSLSGSNPTGLGEGTYTVVVTDSDQCSDTLSFTLNPVLTIEANQEIILPDCGESNGAITLNISGGSGNYNIQWNTGATANALTNLPAGTYSVVIQDVQDNTCELILSFNLGSLNSPLELSFDVTPTSCIANTGAITVLVEGGAEPYEFLWSTEETTESISGLGVGTYTVTVTDADGCVQTGSASVAFDNPPVISFTPVNTTCGLNNGLIVVSIAGGTPELTLTWNDGFDGEDRIFLAPGFYELIVTDAAGCADTASTTILPSVQPTLDTVAVIRPTCGNNDGSISIIFNNATNPVIYQWQKDGVNFSTQANISQLASGEYTLIAADFAGCRDTIVVNLNNTNEPTLAFAVDSTDCGAATGSIILTVEGGSGIFTVFWPELDITDQTTVTNLAAGCYTVEVTDDNGCFVVGSACVPIRDGFELIFDVEPPTCNLSNGSITVSAPDAQAPLTFNWINPESTDATITGIGEGTYTVEVTDATGCSITGSISVANTGLPQVSGTEFPASCIGDDGAVVLIVSGGVYPYSYLWDDLNATTDSIVIDLAPGTYTVVVTDAAGCEVTASFIIDQVAPFSLDANPVNPSCGLNNGSIQLEIINGSGFELVIWSSPDDPDFSAFDEFIDNLAPGIYIAYVVNDDGCEDSLTVVLENQDPYTLLVSSEDATCNLSNGTATVTIEGQGSLPYTYIWCNGDTTEVNTISGLAPGACSVTVIDAIGCSVTTEFNINQLGDIQILASALPTTCGLNNGEATVEIIEGAAPFIIQWSNGTSDPTALQLAPGQYIVSVTDANGCSVSDTVNVAPSIALVIEPETLTNSECINPTGSVTVNILSGNDEYTFEWSNGENTQTISGLSAGIYTVNVTDGAGCTASATAIVVNENEPVLQIEIVSQPNCEEDNGEVNVSIGNTGGNITITLNGNPIASDTVFTLTGLAAGTYELVVSDDDTGCEVTQSFTLINADAPSATLVVSNDTLCLGESVTVSIQLANASSYNLVYSVGGIQTSLTTTNSEVTFDLTPATNTTVAIVSIGSIDVTCPGNIFGSPVTIVVNPVPAAPIITNIGPLTFCQGDSVFLSSSYQFNNVWSPGGATTQFIFASVSGSYTVTHTNEFGCAATSEPVVVNVQSGANVNVGPDITICQGDSLQVTATGADSYIWSPTIGLSGSIIANPLVGPPVSTTYVVTGTTACGTGSDTLVVTVLPNVIFDLGAPITVCENNPFELSLPVSLPPGAIISWGPSAAIVGPSNQSSVTINVSANTQVFATVVSGNQCVYSDTLEVNVLPQPAAPLISADGPLSFCEGGQVILTSSIGSGIVWSPSGLVNIPSILVTESGSYSVTFTDANSCSATSETIVVEVAPEPEVVITSSGFTTICEGESVTLTSSLAGDWSGPVTATNTNTISASAAGTYTVNVSTASGCSANASITMTVVPNPEPPIITSDGPVDICEGSTLVLTANYSTGLVWSPGGETTQSITVTTAGTFTVTYTNSIGCSSTSEPIVTTVKPNLPPVITGDTLVCGSGPISNTLTASPGFVAYQWLGGPNSPSYTVTAPGTYTVVGTNANGCQAQASITVVQAPALDITMASPLYFGLFNISTFGGSDGSINVTVAGGTPNFTYSWLDNAQINTADRNNLPAGSYTVIVTDQLGCVDTASIELIQPQLLILPNGFTPNGDGFNDNFVIPGIEAYPDNTFIVFNRWGNEVYTRRGYANQWNGTNNNGNNLPDGTYFVILELPGKDTLKGYVDLRRN